MTIALELQQLKNLSRRRSALRGIDLQVEAGILRASGAKWSREIDHHRYYQLIG